jgi:hypothetical protein
MKNLYTPLLLIMLYNQLTQSMETSSFPNKKDDGYTVITKSIEDIPPYITFVKELNPLSEKLYEKNLNENDIQRLVDNGAIINYHSPKHELSIPLHYATDQTKQGIKNMKKIIGLGADLHNIEQSRNPLLIAIKNNNTEMIKLLMPYENPTVTVYREKHTEPREEYKDDKEETIEVNIIKSIKYNMKYEKDNCKMLIRRELIIKNTFHHKNIDAIKLLLTLKLMSANRGLYEIADHRAINKEILNLILQHGPTNIKDILSALKEKNSPEFEQNIRLLERVCNAENQNLLQYTKITQ